MSGGGGGGNDEEWRKTGDPVAGGGGSGGGGKSPPGNPCDIVDVTMLNSPDRAVLSTLSAGDVLTLNYLQGPPRRLVAETDKGQAAGSITSIALPQLIKCMQANVKYKAEVISVKGALCQVRISIA